VELSLSDSDHASPLAAAVSSMSPLAAAETPSPLTMAKGSVEPHQGAKHAADVSKALSFREPAAQVQPFAWLRKVPRESRQKIRGCRSPRSARAALTTAISGNSLAPAGLLEDLRRHTQQAQRQVMDLEEELERRKEAQEAKLQALRAEHKRKCKQAKLQLLASLAPEDCGFEAESLLSQHGGQVMVQDSQQLAYDDTRSDVGSVCVGAAAYDELWRRPPQLTSPSSMSSGSPRGFSRSSPGSGPPEYSSRSR